MHTTTSKMIFEPKWQQLKCLLVDDNRGKANFVRSQLSSIGIVNIDIANGYESAIKKCVANSYHFILINYELAHTINGSELTNLLLNKQLINSQCHVLLLSDSSSTEYVLTCISNDQTNLLNTPTNVAVLRQKLTNIYTEVIRQDYLRTTLNTMHTSDAVELYLNEIQMHGHSSKLDKLLFDFLIDNDELEIAASTINRIQTKKTNHQLSFYEAKIFLKRGNLTSAIFTLESLVSNSPLSIEALDLYAHCLEMNKQYWDAMTIAKRALNLTPSINHRAIRVARLASFINRPQDLHDAGLLLANHLSIIDVKWVSQLSLYCEYFRNAYQSADIPFHKRQYKQSIKQVFKHAQSRLLNTQRPFLTLYYSITLAQLLLLDGQQRKSKRRLLFSLSIYYNHMHSLPSLILIELLGLLFKFGETELMSQIYQTLKLRDCFDQQSRSRMEELRINSDLVFKINRMDMKLDTAFSLITSDTNKAIAIYSDTLEKFPHSSEANLGLIQCLLNCHSYNDNRLDNCAKNLHSMPLPAKLDHWRLQIVDKCKQAHHNRIRKYYRLLKTNKRPEQSLQQRPYIY